MDELTGRLAIYCALGRDVRSFRRTLCQYGSAEAALAGPTLRARAREAVGPAVLANVEALIAGAEQAGLRWTWPGQPDFPPSLAISEAQLLCLRGTDPAPGPALAVVGSRECDAYGVELAGYLGEAAAEANVPLVSGGADGIDKAAHRGALAAGGHTVVVLGTGLITGLRRDPWIAEALETGRTLVVSELLPEASGAQWSFPDRNRLIAAWGNATVVVQAGRRSGTLHTARHAIKYARPLWAIPGDLGKPQTEGVNELLARQEARLLRHPMDLEADLGIQGLGHARWARPSPRAQPAPALAQSDVPTRPVVNLARLLEAEGPLSASALETRLGSGVSELLLEGELEGLVARDGQGLYASTRAAG